jgi:ATP-binding cassette, subfamily G (WHITE), eye pigment precursor transporter
MAMSIVDSMRSLAKNGKTIVCTIHQPSSEIFEMFDKVYLLSEGRFAFTGDQEAASKFFERSVSASLLSILYMLLI